MSNPSLPVRSHRLNLQWRHCRHRRPRRCRGSRPSHGQRCCPRSNQSGRMSTNPLGQVRRRHRRQILVLFLLRIYTIHPAELIGARGPEISLQKSRFFRNLCFSRNLVFSKIPFWGQAHGPGPWAWPMGRGPCPWAQDGARASFFNSMGLLCAAPAGAFSSAKNDTPFFLSMGLLCAAPAGAFFVSQK